MYSAFLTMAVGLVIPLTSGQEFDTALKMTTAKGIPCDAQLEILAENHCSKRKRFLAGGPSVNWFQAKVNCEKYGYKLATIVSKEDTNNALRQLRVQGDKAPNVWLAFNDLAEEGTRVWASNAKLNTTYFNWFVGEPNNANDFENCGNLYPDGSLNDFFCFANLRYICEYYSVAHC